MRLFLKQLFHFTALFFRAFTTRKPGDSFFHVRRNRRDGTAGHFLDIAVEKLQQDFEIIIHR